MQQINLSKDLYNYGTADRVNKLHNILINRQKSLTIVMEDIDDPHNIAACLRSCDAVGILEICLVYTNENKKASTFSRSSSASAKKWVEHCTFNNIMDCYNYLRASGKKIYTTHLAKESISLYDMDLTKDIALVFGNEHSGVSDMAVKYSDGNFLIPQIGVIQSLNISVACAVSVFEAFRQRIKINKFEQPELSDTEVTTKLKEWLLK